MIFEKFSKKNMFFGKYSKKYIVFEKFSINMSAMPKYAKMTSPMYLDLQEVYNGRLGGWGL